LSKKTNGYAQNHLQAYHHHREEYGPARSRPEKPVIQGETVVVQPHVGPDAHGAGQVHMAEGKIKGVKKRVQGKEKDDDHGRGDQGQGIGRVGHGFFEQLQLLFLLTLRTPPPISLGIHKTSAC
jgi:hypothetical protein